MQKYQDYGATGFTLSNTEQVEHFMKALTVHLNKTLGKLENGKPCQVHVSIVTGEEKFGPMVDCEWAAAAMPCTVPMLRHYLHRMKGRLDPPVYRRMKRADHRGQRIRLLSLHDLRVLRGAMLANTRGKHELIMRGDIE